MCGKSGYCEEAHYLTFSTELCVEAIQPRTNPECSGGTVSVPTTLGAGQFCLCGCKQASSAISQLQRCASSTIMSIIATYLKPRASPEFLKNMEKYQPDILKETQAVYDKFQAYKKAHPEDKSGLKFLKSDESPCASLRSTALAECKKCPACKYFL